MREIKFRAWDKGERIMCHNANHLSPDWFSKHPNLTPMQYTGLKDKNGTEIYEGDILRMSPLCKYVVVFRKGCFAEINEPDDGWIHYFKNMADGKDQILDEVIGNIYENAELLK